MDATAAERNRRMDLASLALHEHGLSAADVAERLEQQLLRLGLADRAVFVPGILDDPSDPGAVNVLVTRPDGHVVGSLHCEGVTRESRELIEVLVTHAGVAMDTAARTAEIERREESVRRVAERLQDSLLPHPPQVPHTLLEVRYRAAGRDTRVGGDFYDLFTLPDDRLLIVVGDVVGKGVEAAGRTSRITQTLRALALQGLELNDLLRLADRQVTYQDPEIMATVWCGLYEPGTGEIQFASLGHPPALLVRADGDAIRLELEGLPLGMRDLLPTPPETRARLLESRDLIVLYTDGVVEGSGNFLAGQEALLAAIRERRAEPLTDIIDTALDELLQGAGYHDDAVMLLLRRR